VAKYRWGRRLSEPDVSDYLDLGEDGSKLKSLYDLLWFRRDDFALDDEIGATPVVSVAGVFRQFREELNLAIITSGKFLAEFVRVYGGDGRIPI